jgi:hypothetical protein
MRVRLETFYVGRFEGLEGTEGVWVGVLFKSVCFPSIARSLAFTFLWVTWHGFSWRDDWSRVE